MKKPTREVKDAEKKRRIKETEDESKDKKKRHKERLVKEMLKRCTY